MPTSEWAIEAHGLVKNFGEQRAVDNVDLTVAPGIVYGVLGPNGAGKTTAIHTMLGLMKPTQGEARLFGRNPRDAAARMRVGAMLQSSGTTGGPPRVTWPRRPSAAASGGPAHATWSC